MNIRQLVGVQARSSYTEKLISGLGAFLGIFSVFLVTDWLTNFETAIALLPSMGASAVLVMAVPHGMLSQPWPVVAGNTVSAAIGVAVSLLVDNSYVAAGLAVGLAIAAMHLLRCIHPPGGATALVPVLAGESVQGFGFVLIPTLANCLVILLIAVVFNNIFHWRRYPASLMKYDHSMYHPETYNISVSHIERAMETLDELIDIAPEQIKYIVDRADEIMLQDHDPGFKIRVGHYYTNGAPGRQWSVRQVIDISNHPGAADKRVIYRTVDGNQKGESGTVRLYEFKNWAKEPMLPASEKPAKK